MAAYRYLTLEEQLSREQLFSVNSPSSPEAGTDIDLRVNSCRESESRLRCSHADGVAADVRGCCGRPVRMPGSVSGMSVRSDPGGQARPLPVSVPLRSEPMGGPIELMESGPIGDLLLVCSDGCSIRAHSQILQLASSVLRQALSATLKASA